MIGFPALNYALYPMLKKPDTDSAVDIEYLLKVVRESWIDRKSSAHSKISSPCEMRKCNSKSRSSFENRSHPSIPWGKKSNTEGIVFIALSFVVLHSMNQSRSTGSTLYITSISNCVSKIDSASEK